MHGMLVDMDTKQKCLDRATIVDKNFIRCLQEQNFPGPHSDVSLQQSNLTVDLAKDIFRSQVESRHLDFIARVLRKSAQGFYTIGSSGHEGNAAIAAAFSLEDMAFLHYRSCAFMLQRARQYQGDSKLYDHLLSLAAAHNDPASGGRHKVFGSIELNVPPQTSTIASHLPKAVGAAFSIALAKKLQIEHKLSNEAVILCSFGDASVNHSTAQGALNTAQWIVKHNLPLPIVFICEDNGFGISVPTSCDWIEETCSKRAGITYIACDGRNLFDVYHAACQAQNIARKFRKPVFLHMKTVRLLGHAGSDVEFQYRTQEEIELTERDDPLLHSARLMLTEEILTVADILALYQETEQKICLLAKKVSKEKKLSSKAEIMYSLMPVRSKSDSPPPQINENIKQNKQYNMAQCINLCLQDLMIQYSNIVLFGEDVGKKGGVYQVTDGLQKKFGFMRVFDSLLDEQTILGTAIGLAHNNILPIPEIQFLAYLHNAVDQLRGEAATLSFFSDAQYQNPMVIRLPGLAYQKGFGGHFHNDNSIGFLQEIPGIIIACPSNGHDAVCLLRECVRLAYEEQRVVIFLEPIALYHTKDLLQFYPNVMQRSIFGELGVEGSGNRLLFISYGNGAHLVRQAARKIYEQYKIDATIIDLRWLKPLNIDSLIPYVQRAEHVIVVDECRRTGSLSETLIVELYDKMELKPITRITGEDCFIPLGDAWQHILPSVEQIFVKAKKLLGIGPG